MADELPHALRSDAKDNRDKVLQAARELFAERGLGVTMREIARHAGVGPATLYRRFPAKQTLVDAAFRDEARACRTAVEDGYADTDAWRGFCTALTRLVVLNAVNRGFVDAFMAAGVHTDGLAAHRASLLRTLAGLVARAQDAGEFRRDATVDDVVLVLVAGRALAATPRAGRDAAARRYVALSVDALRASDAHGSLPRGARLAP